MIKIGKLRLSSSCVLSPLSGVSDFPFRMINRSFGCELTFVEMINARSLVYKNKRTEKMLSTMPADRPLGIQLLGNDPDVIGRALEIIDKYKFDIIDFNAACPVEKVIKRGEGASLLKDPHKLKKILKVMVDNSKTPVTVKIRSGWDGTSVNAKEVALYCQDAGIKGLFVHGRTRVQGYSGNVDYNIIKEVKGALDIPVIASGDILSPELIKRMFEETGCDGVAVARGALGNPWIFKEASEFLKNGKIVNRPDIHEITDTMIKHLNASIDFYGEIIGLIDFRKFFIWYTRGLHDMKFLRNKAFHIKSKNDMIGVINELVR